MPRRTNPSKPGAAAMGAAGLAPLAIALVVGNAIIPSTGTSVASNSPTAPNKCEEGIENFHECHASYPTGCSGSGNYDGYLNFLKNQYPARDVTPVRVFNGMGDYHDLESRTPKDLAKSNHLQFRDQLAAMGEGQPHAVIGYLYYAKQEGAESSNCELTAPDDTDFHIGIGFTKPTAKGGPDSQAVVVEMTPQYRAKFAPEWTLADLKKAIGKQVKVVGQLMADNEHNVPKDNCGLPGAGESCWRASIWELHPVTSFHICQNETGCTADGPGWQDLGQEAAAH